MYTKPKNIKLIEKPKAKQKQKKLEKDCSSILLDTSPAIYQYQYRIYCMKHSVHNIILKILIKIMLLMNCTVDMYQEKFYIIFFDRKRKKSKQQFL